MVIIFYLISKKACEKPEYLSWYEKIGLSIYAIGPILIVIGVYLSTYGANTFKYVVALLVFIGGGMYLSSLIGGKITNPYGI